uniref:G-protein coupled receptors family 1 profile domain-containing protein n=1 Tax=Ciona savignyi TaxID=51511 RepID=H2Z3F8_CIOSA
MWVVSLCSSHVLTCATSIPFTLVSTVTEEWVLGSVFCQICGFYSSVFQTVSILSVAGIALDRYHVVSSPFSKRIKKSKVRLLIFFSWWSAVLACAPPLIGIGLYRYSPSRRKCSISWSIGGSALIFTVFYTSLLYLVPCAATICSYRLIYKVTRLQAVKHNRAMLTRNNSRSIMAARGIKKESTNTLNPPRRTFTSLFTSKPTLSLTSPTKPTPDGKSTWIIAAALVVLLFSWSPYFIRALYLAATGQSTSSWLDFIVTWLSTTTCVSDPLVYGVLTQNFRSHFRKLFSRINFRKILTSKPTTNAKSKNVSVDSLCHVDASSEFHHTGTKDSFETVSTGSVEEVECGYAHSGANQVVNTITKPLNSSLINGFHFRGDEPHTKSQINGHLCRRSITQL